MTGLTIANKTDFSEMDNAGISKEHWKIMFISGMGFFTDAYDLFVIGVVRALLKPIWHAGKGSNDGTWHRCDTGRKSSCLECRHTPPAR